MNTPVPPNPQQPHPMAPPVTPAPPQPAMYTPPAQPAASPVQNTIANAGSLLEVTKENQTLLASIAGNQEMMLTEMRKRNALDRWRFWLGILKSLLIALLVLTSLYFSYQMIQGLLSNLGNLGGGIFPNVTQMLGSDILGSGATGVPRPSVGTTPSPDQINDILQSPDFQNQINNFLR